MPGKEKKKQIEERYFIAIERLFHNLKFAKEIRLFRVKIGIPEKGYSTFEQYYSFLKAGDLKEKHVLHKSTIVPFLFNLSIKYKYPSNHVYWIEAFFALGYNYKKFENQIPFHTPREYFIYGPTCNLDILNLSDDHMNLAIYPGATLNSIRDFLSENWKFIESMLKAREDIFGKTPSVRKVGNRDRLSILQLADNKKINSAGIWIGGETKPECLKGILADQTKKIITEERKKRRIRENG